MGGHEDRPKAEVHDGAGIESLQQFAQPAFPSRDQTFLDHRGRALDDAVGHRDREQRDGRGDREDRGDAVAQVATVEDHVDRAVLEQELAALESLGQRLTHGLLDDAGPGEPDQRARFGDVEVAEHREATLLYIEDNAVNRLVVEELVGLGAPDELRLCLGERLEQAVAGGKIFF